MVSDSADPLPAELASCSIPKTKALCVEHVGSYDHLGNAWSAANQFVRYKKLKQSKLAPFEIYRNDPREVAPADRRTEIHLPLK